MPQYKRRQKEKDSEKQNPDTRSHTELFRDQSNNSRRRRANPDNSQQVHSLTEHSSQSRKSREKQRSRN